MPFIINTEEAAPPAPGGQIFSSFSGPARLQLSPQPRDRPGHRRGEKLRVPLVPQEALSLDPPCWLGWGFEKTGGASGSPRQPRGGAVCGGGEAMMRCPGWPGLSLGQSPPARQTSQVGFTPSVCPPQEGTANSCAEIPAAAALPRPGRGTSMLPDGARGGGCPDAAPAALCTCGRREVASCPPVPVAPVSQGGRHRPGRVPPEGHLLPPSSPKTQLEGPAHPRCGC